MFYPKCNLSARSYVYVMQSLMVVSEHRCEYLRFFLDMYDALSYNYDYKSCVRLIIEDWKMKQPALANAELAVMDLLWQNDRMTAKQICEALYPDATRAQHGSPYSEVSCQCGRNQGSDRSWSTR